MTWSLVAAATLPLALGVLLLRRRRARGRRTREARRGRSLSVEFGRRGGGVFDALAWPTDEAAPDPSDYRRPAGIRGKDPAILPPPREIPDEDIE